MTDSTTEQEKTVASSSTPSAESGEAKTTAKASSSPPSAESDEAKTENTANSRRQTGRVTSVARDKTITVVCMRRVRHSFYGKYLTRRSKFHAHDENNQCSIGDLVVIRECTPYSKTKSWQLETIVESSSDAKTQSL